MTERKESVSPEEASQYANDLWTRYASIASAVLDVRLPPDVHDRFQAFFDGLDLGTLPVGVPEWVLDLYSVQDAVTAAHYHERRIVEIEAVVVDAMSRAVAAIPRLPARSNTAMVTMTLSFEYQAYLFAYRRAFEYLCSGICGAFGLARPENIKYTAKRLISAEPKYQPWVDPMIREVRAVARQFDRILAKDSPRNTTAHRRPVPAGTMRLWLDPAHEPRIGLEQGGEDLPVRDLPTKAGERLSVVLEQQLAKLSDAVFELLALLPTPSHLLDLPRLR